MKIGIGLGVTSTALQGPFSPNALFANGEEGVWYDLSDISTLSQDSAGTTPVTAAGQPVGRMLDKSGNGNHATQSTGASRPTYQVDAGGNAYLDFNGTSSSIVSSAFDLTGTDQVAAFAGVRRDGEASKGIILEFSADALLNDGAFYISGPAAAVAGYGFGSSGTANSNKGETTDAGPILNVVGLIADISAPVLETRVDGVIRTKTASQGAGNYGNYALYLGATGGVSDFFDGRIYGVIVRGGATTAGQANRIESYLADKTGVTL